MEIETSGQVYEEDKEAVNDLPEKADHRENPVSAVVNTVQEAASKVTPVPSGFDTVSSPAVLKARLDWGEPALSILDVRDRTAFNYERITGAIPIPIQDLVESVKASFEDNRDLFIYSESDTYAVEALTQLQSAGFRRVSLIQGGLPAWKAIGGPTEGQVSIKGRSSL